MQHLNRQAAPFDQALWGAIEEAAVHAAREMLTARRFLDVEGPFGVGFTTVEVGPDSYLRQATEDSAAVLGGRAIPVPMIQQRFDLSIRRLAAAQDIGQPLDLAVVEDAAEAVAKREEEMIYHGLAEIGLYGLLNAPAHLEAEAGELDGLQAMLEGVLAAVNRLDDAGYRGPYALVLSPHLYNGAFRRYEHTDMLQVQHLTRICQRNVHKAPIEGAAVIDPRVDRLLIGQDLRAGFVSQDGVHYQLYLRESLVLQLDSPDAVCVIASRSAQPRAAKR